mmetsp:Transcript_15522/g.21777  ORF Transcript_15522/g.21777 Transcript_15522/m.21777 type:complete len:125 (-) Transcript_15522:591-965(-)
MIPSPSSSSVLAQLVYSLPSSFANVFKMSIWQSVRVVILEKYTEYKRKHVLKIEALSLETGGINDEILNSKLRELAGKTPTNKIEETFKELAYQSGVDIKYGEYVQNIHTIKDKFPSARYIIGL